VNQIDLIFRIHRFYKARYFPSSFISPSAEFHDQFILQNEDRNIERRELPDQPNPEQEPQSHPAVHLPGRPDVSLRGQLHGPLVPRATPPGERLPLRPDSQQPNGQADRGSGGGRGTVGSVSPGGLSAGTVRVDRSGRGVVQDWGGRERGGGVFRAG